VRKEGELLQIKGGISRRTRRKRKKGEGIRNM